MHDASERCSKMRSTIYQRAARNKQTSITAHCNAIIYTFSVDTLNNDAQDGPTPPPCTEDIPYCTDGFWTQFACLVHVRRMHVFCSVSFSVWPAPVLYRLCKEKEGPPTHLLNLATVQHQQKTVSVFFCAKLRHCFCKQHAILII